MCSHSQMTSNKSGYSGTWTSQYCAKTVNKRVGISIPVERGVVEGDKEARGGSFVKKQQQCSLHVLQFDTCTGGSDLAGGPTSRQDKTW